MKKHTVNLILSKDAEQATELTVWYHPARLLREATHTQPQEWSDPVIDSVEDEDGKKLTDSEINAFGLSDEEWISINEINK